MVNSLTHHFTADDGKKIEYKCNGREEIMRLFRSEQQFRDWIQGQYNEAKEIAKGRPDMSTLAYLRIENRSAGIFFEFSDSKDVFNMIRSPSKRPVGVMVVHWERGKTERGQGYGDAGKGASRRDSDDSERTLVQR